MASKLDQSLDTIMTDTRKNNRRRSARNVKKTKAAPVGGIQKTGKPARPARPAQPAAASSSSKPVQAKIVISGLPKDVREPDLQEYLRQQVGAVKNVMLNYGPSGQSRGVAIVTFPKQDLAAKALTTMDGLKIDDKPIRVEALVDAEHAPAPTAPKTLNDRVSKPKTEKEKPRPATAAPKNAGDKKNVRGRGRGRGRGGRNNSTRAKPKTADELDQEMTDYWNNTAAAAGGDTAMATNGGPVQAAPADTMEDEIM